jgi:ribosomal protein S15P/S13E
MEIVLDNDIDEQIAFMADRIERMTSFHRARWTPRRDLRLQRSLLALAQSRRQLAKS